ncbi:MAG: SPFH domain-containing protein [Myxococcota bacterium]
MRHVFEVALSERVVVLRDGLPVRALAPGRHILWGWGRYRALRFELRDLLVDARPEVRAVLQKGWFEEVSLRPHERGVIYRDGTPVAWLRPGVHRYWTLAPGLGVVRFSVEEAMPTLTDELRAVIPPQEYIDVTILAHERGVLYRQGHIEDLLGPGRYTLWTYPESTVAIAKVDTRRQELSLASQELMTRDKVTLRLNLTAAYSVGQIGRFDRPKK